MSRSRPVQGNSGRAGISSLLGRILAGLLFLALGAGGNSARAAEDLLEDRSIPTLKVTILVEEIPARDSWRVRYQLSRPVRGLFFPRSRSRYRVANWKILPDQDVQWGELRGKEVLLPGPRGQPFKEVTLELETDSTERPSDYRLHYRYSDGSRLVNTAHLEVRALGCGERAVCESQDLLYSREPVSYTWKFQAGPGRKVALLERYLDRSLTWEQPPYGFDLGTYAYFGNLERVQFPRHRLLLDPGLPGWMAELTRKHLGKFFDFYVGMTGKDLDLHPLILVSYEESTAAEVSMEEGGLAHKGGALAGVMQLHAQGPNWKTETKEARIQWAKFLAHEAFHFWNGLMTHYRLGASERWLSEGSADYFAHVVLNTFGFLEQVEFDKIMADAANRCVIGLYGRPMVMARQTGSDHRIVYQCGMALHFLAERQLRAATSGRTSLGDLYRKLIDRAFRSDRSYSTYDFLELLQELSGLPLLVVPHEQLLHMGVGSNGEEFFAREFEKLGVPIVLGPVDKAYQAEDITQTLVARLIAACDCSGRWSYQFRPDSVEYLPVEGCSLFQARTRITEVNGLSLRSQAPQAYQSALDAVDQKRPLVLNRERGEDPIRMECPPGRTGYFPRHLLHVSE